MASTNSAKGAAAATANALQKLSATKSDNRTFKRPAGRAQALTVIGSITKSNSSQLRISISTWRGERKLELRECTRVFGKTFFPAGAPLTMDLDRVPELIALLSKAVRR
jgi:hypothetical protein